MTRTVDDLLTEARSKIERHSVERAALALDAGALVVDIRPIEQRSRDGEIPGAVVLPRNVVEWRLDPASPYRIPEVETSGGRVVIVCDEGYQSSLVAATLREFGLDAGDLVGGFQAWRAAGMPVSVSGG